MAEELSYKELLSNLGDVALRSVVRTELGWIVEEFRQCRAALYSIRHEPFGRSSSSNAAAFPDCGIPSTARHSSYVRHLKDLPLQGLAVKIRLRVGRRRCRNSNCERKIFTERVPTIAAPHRQRTERMESIVHLVSRSLGGRPAERLMRRLGMAVDFPRSGSDSDLILLANSIEDCNQRWGSSGRRDVSCEPRG
jgi:hypothetical protein